MGSSAKRKKEKKQDFQKPKLRVGKEKAKASNFTDTSFKAKSIVIAQQSISTTAPSVTSQFSHHLALLTSKSEAQRRDSLAYLTTISASGLHDQLPQPVVVILSKIQPLILDGANGVRQQLLKLLQSLPQSEIPDRADQLLLYTRAGMTHISSDIRSFSIDILTWLLEAAGEAVVSCAGGWVKTLKTFLILLRWQTDAPGKWSQAKASFGKTGDESKLMVKQMKALALFLKVGLEAPTREQAQVVDFPLCHTEHHRLQNGTANPYRHLNLFGTPRDEDSEIYEGREDRQRIFHERAWPAIGSGLEQAKKAGGEVGRAAAQLNKIIADGMVGFSKEGPDE